jgi:uncharacterized membrane protein YfcA
MPTDLILSAFGVRSGVTTVLFGFGGGFVIVPLLFSILTLDPGRGMSACPAAMHVAVATSTAVMVVNSFVATMRHARLGNLVAAELWPLAGYIAIGAGFGAMVATSAPDGLMRWAFVAYLGVTILDCLLRRGFLSRPAGEAPLPRMPAPLATVAGFIIGAIATFLGVGGSVMTVPMNRRRDMDMTRATAMATPLTLPVALVGVGFYMLLPTGTKVASQWQIGSVDGLAFIILVIGSLLGIRAASPFIGRIPDIWHARTYLLLLVVVLLGMIV